MKTFVLIVLAVAMPCTLAYAGDGHNHEAAVEPAPHGGVLRDAPPFKVELVLNKDNAKLYVYDKTLKPVVLDKPAVTGHLKFPRQTKDMSVVLKKSESGEYYQGVLPGISKVHRYDLHLNVEVGSQKVVADFGVDNIH